MARHRGPRPQRGGKENKHPRSLGVVLERVRQDFQNSTVEELDEHFRNMDVEGECFGFWESVTGNDSTELGKRISMYECASRYPPWGTIVRYGVVSETWPGILLLVSGFYAFMRDAAKADVNEQKRAEELADAAEMARKTIAMCKAAEAMIAIFNEKGGLVEKLACPAGYEWEDEVTRRRQAALVVGPLLEAYRNG